LSLVEVEYYRRALKAERDEVKKSNARSKK